jgi:hypothetical protein
LPVDDLSPRHPLAWRYDIPVPFVCQDHMVEAIRCPKSGVGPNDLLPTIQNDPLRANL